MSVLSVSCHGVSAGGMCADSRRVCNIRRLSAKCTCVSALFRKCTDNGSECALYERGVSVRCDREDVCRQREDICRQCSGNAQTTEVSVRCMREVCRCSVRCVSEHVTATDTLRR